MVQIQDRPVAVDWALSKKEFESQSKPTATEAKPSTQAGLADLSDDEDQDTASESEGESEEEEDGEGSDGEGETRAAGARAMGRICGLWVHALWG